MPTAHKTIFNLGSFGMKGTDMEAYAYHHTLKESSMTKLGSRIHASSENGVCKHPRQ